MNKKRVVLILDSCYLCPHYEEFPHCEKLDDLNNVKCFCFYENQSIQLTHEDIINLSKCKLDEYKK
jgi:hypothetical protein